MSGIPTTTPPEGAPAIRVTAMPENLNPYGDIFGGWLMSQMALAAASLASRHAKGKAVLVGANDLAFTAPVAPGDELSIWPSLERVGRSSMTIFADAWRRDRDGEGTNRVATGRFTFVALDGDGKARAIAQ